MGAILEQRLRNGERAFHLFDGLVDDLLVFGRSLRRELLDRALYQRDFTAAPEKRDTHVFELALVGSLCNRRFEAAAARSSRRLDKFKAPVSIQRALRKYYPDFLGQPGL